MSQVMVRYKVKRRDESPVVTQLHEVGSFRLIGSGS